MIRRRVSFCGLIPLRSKNFWNPSCVGLVLAVTIRWMRILIQHSGMVMMRWTYRHSDPTKVRLGERNHADMELKLLKMTEVRTVALDPPATAASGGSSDSIDRLFDVGDNAGQEHPAKKDDDVQEEVIAKDASEVVTEKPQKKQKRKVVRDVSSSTLPPNKLRDDHQSLPPSTGGKSLSVLRSIVPEGAVIPSDTARPLVTASVTPMPEVEPVDSVSGLNLRTRPPYERYVVSSDSSHYSGSYSEAASFIRSAADVSVVTVAVTTTANANVATSSKAKDAPKDFEHIGDSASLGRVDADAASISKLKNPSISSDSFYASQSLDTETMRRVYVPRWKVTNDSVLDDPYVCRDMTDRLAPCLVCLGAEVRMRAEHTLEKKDELEDKCAERTAFLSERDAEIVHLKSLLSLKEVEAAEAISFRSQLSVVEAADAAKGTELRDLKEKNFALEGEKNVLSERVETLESVIASKDVEVASLSSHVANLTADFSGFPAMSSILRYIP
ncbi:hypothetical protein Tco_0344757 [Tanacetum coccineum]